MRDVEVTLLHKSDKEETMRCIFDQTRTDLDKVIRDQMAEFCVRKATGVLVNESGDVSV